jgi:hypothetical protein
VPELASGFSAFGMLGALDGNVQTHSIHHNLSVEPDWLETIFAELQQRMVAGFGDVVNNVVFERFAELKYSQQFHLMDCRSGAGLQAHHHRPTPVYGLRHGGGRI